MRKLFLSVLLVIALLAFGGAALAQDPVCGGLAEADCAILTASQAAMAEVSAATFTFDLMIDAGEVIGLAGEGAFEANLAAFNIDPTSIDTTDPVAALSLVSGLIKEFTGDLTLTITAPPSAGLPGPLTLELLLIDGVGYLNFGGLAELLGGPETLQALGLPTGWAGLDLAGGIEMLGGMAAGMDTGDLTAGATDMDPAQQEALMAAVTQYVTITRGENMGNEAVFNISIDFAGLFADPILGQLILEAAMSQSGGMPDVSEAEMQEALGMMSQLGAAFSASIENRIDLSSNFSTYIGFDIRLDGAAMAAMGGGGEEVPNIAITGAVNYANFNVPTGIAAPADAPIATIMDLMGMAGGGF